jgi:hypothetical protein
VRSVEGARVFLAGETAGYGEECVDVADVLGRVVAVERAGRWQPLDSRAPSETLRRARRLRNVIVFALRGVARRLLTGHGQKT